MPFAAVNPVYGWMDGVEYDCRISSTENKTLSQSLVNWADQPVYASYTVYFIVVVIFLSTLVRAYYLAIDYRNPSNTGAASDAPPSSSPTPTEVPTSMAAETKATLINETTTTTNPAVSKQERTKSFHPLGRLFALCRFVGYRRPPIWAQRLGASPSLAMNLVVVALFLYMCLWCFLPRFWYRACAYMGTPPLAVRAGLMANALVPFIYACVGKVNVLSGITGVSYERLNFFHRALGWIALFFAFVHTVPIVIQQTKEGIMYKSLVRPDDRIYANGVGWLVILFVLCVLSMSSFRKAFYETWLILHWPLGIGSLGVAFWHCENMLKSWEYLYATVAVLLSGYCYRALMKTNFLNLFGGRWYSTDKAVVREIPGTDCLEVSVFSEIIRRWAPGEHVYLRFPSIEPFGNHPFSVASLCQAPKSDCGHTARSLLAKDDDSMDTAVAARKARLVSTSDNVPVMKIVVRRRNGFTRKLHVNATNQAGELTPLSVMVEGPYGGLHRRLDAFDEVVLCATGNGSAATVPFLLDLAPRMSRGTTCVRKVRLVWVVRYAEDVQFFDSEISQVLQTVPSAFLDLHIYVVNDGTPASQRFRDLEVDGCKVHYVGKPNIPETLNGWSQDYAPRTLFVCCGSRTFNYDVGNTVAGLQTLVLTGKKNAAGETYNDFYLQTEMFDW